MVLIADTPETNCAARLGAPVRTTLIPGLGKLLQLQKGTKKYTKMQYVCTFW